MTRAEAIKDRHRSLPIRWFTCVTYPKWYYDLLEANGIPVPKGTWTAKVPSE